MTLNSPPPKLPKSSTNLSRHDSGLDQFVTNFEKLHSPSKHVSNRIDLQNSTVTTSACRTPVSVSTSKLTVSMHSSQLKTPYPDNLSHKSVSGTEYSRSPSTKSTDKHVIDNLQPPHTHSYYPYLYPPPPPQPYPYAIIPPIHSPYDVTEPSSKISTSSKDTWPFSQFNRPMSSLVSNPSNAEKIFYPPDIKPHLSTFNFGMALPHSPFPWYPKPDISLPTQCFSHPNFLSSRPGSKSATTIKLEPKTPTLTQITTSVTPPTSAIDSQDEQLDVVTIVPQKNEPCQSGIGSRTNESSADYSTHFDLDLWGNKKGNIPSDDTNAQEIPSRPSSV